MTRIGNGQKLADFADAVDARLASSWAEYELSRATTRLRRQELIKAGTPFAMSLVVGSVIFAGLLLHLRPWTTQLQVASEHPSQSKIASPRAVFAEIFAPKQTSTLKHTPGITVTVPEGESTNAAKERKAREIVKAHARQIRPYIDQQTSIAHLEPNKTRQLNTLSEAHLELLRSRLKVLADGNLFETTTFTEILAIYRDSQKVYEEYSRRGPTEVAGTPPAAPVSAAAADLSALLERAIPASPTSTTPALPRLSLLSPLDLSVLRTPPAAPSDNSARRIVEEVRDDASMQERLEAAEGKAAAVEQTDPTRARVIRDEALLILVQQQLAALDAAGITAGATRESVQARIVVVTARLNDARARIAQQQTNLTIEIERAKAALETLKIAD